jgi:Putative ATP-dependent Lon protease
VLDPCMGSGHFLVFALPILVAFRMVEDGLSEADAIAAVLADNLFGLEIDPRCTQIAAFALALADPRRRALVSSDTIALDRLDELGSKAFDGFVVRKDLVRKYSKAYPVPGYVVEFLLGRYCASTDPTEIQEGLGIVEKQLVDRCVRTGQEEVFKNKAFKTGSVRLIDTVRARLDAKNACYIAELPSLALKDVRIDERLVDENERILTDGFYAEITLSYDAVIAEERNGRPFAIDALRPIQMSRSDVLDTFYAGRRAFETRGEWIDFLLRSIGFEPAEFDERAKMVTLLRIVPFVERNYITTSSSLDRAAPARVTCSSRCPPMPISYRAAKRRSRACSSIWRAASAASSASTTWSVSTKSPACPSIPRTASTS